MLEAKEIKIQFSATDVEWNKINYMALKVSVRANQIVLRHKKLQNLFVNIDWSSSIYVWKRVDIHISVMLLIVQQNNKILDNTSLV